MATLMTTQYNPALTTISIIVRITIQGGAVDLPPITAQEGELVALAVADGRADWNTSDCCTYAAAILSTQWEVTPQ